MCDHCQCEEEKEGQEGLVKLVDLANTLDAKGLAAEANLIDSLIVEAKKKKDEKKKKKEKEEKEDKKKENKKDDKKKGKKPFWLQKKKAELIQLADTLDSKGFKAEADVIDSIIEDSIGSQLHEVADYLIEHYSDNEDLITNVYNPIRSIVNELQINTVEPTVIPTVVTPTVVTPVQ